MEDKGTSIQAPANWLFAKFGDKDIRIQDHWADDQMAVGITHAASKYLVYISTSCKSPDSFYLSLKNLLYEN